MCCYPEIYIKCEKKILELLQNQQFEECLENIHIRFKNEENLELDFESIEKIKKKTTQNFTEFLKELYLYQVDHPDVVFPTTIVYPNNVHKFAERPVTTLDTIIRSGLIAHKNLRIIVYNYMFELQKIKEKKRQRRLRYKKNRKEKKFIQNL
jgi:hypothetical protein